MYKRQVNAQEGGFLKNYSAVNDEEAVAEFELNNIHHGVLHDGESASENL